MRPPVVARTMRFAGLCALALGALGCGSQDTDKDLAHYHAARVADIDRLNTQEGMPDAWQTHFARADRTGGEEPAALPAPEAIR